ncbi:MAG: hypothetical protein ACAH89_09245 [Rariglobus sp.]|nr:hypothetical protein [Rariglobus sp.]
MISDHHTPVIGGVNGARPQRESGFALLITITLLAFLVLLLVSLASLTRVETQVANNNQQISQARQNALMALNIALGQLQKFTGPDQRTTARADMDVALANVTNRNGRWLAAYGNGAPVDTTYTLKPSQIPANITGANADSKGSQAKLLNWLVSGNEGTAFDPSSTTTVDTDGHIVTAPSAITYTPASTINLTTASVTPVTADTQALLVGSNSATAQSDYVAAPLVAIDAGAGTVPGLTTAARIGRYAWWVGDEGAKARVNLPMASAAQAPQAFVSAQRAAIELMDGQNQTGSTNATQLIGTAAYDPALMTLSNLVSPRQLSMLTPTAATSLPAALKVRFHDLTASSTTVLADAYAGGLKRDLSAMLATGANDASYVFPPDDVLGVPTWGQLRSFTGTTAPAGTAGVAPRLATATTVGIAPVMTYIAYGMQYAAPSGTADGQPIRLAIFPIVVLWNPYTVPLQAHRYQVGMLRRFYPLYQLQVETTPGTWAAKETIDFSRGGARYATGTATTYMRFVVDSPVIPAGASLIFTLQGTESGRDYSAPLAGAPTNVMSPGLNPNGHVLLNYGATFAVGESAKNFRVNGDPLLPIPPATSPPQAFGMSGGEACAYLGEEATPGTSGAASTLNVNGSNNYQWHQFIAHYTPSADGPSNRGPNNRNAQLQTAGLLGPVTQATSLMSAKKGFSDLLLSGIYPDVRWIAQANPRAAIITSTPNTSSLNALNQMGEGGRLGAWQKFYAVPPGLRANSGSSLDTPSGNTPIDSTLFDFRPDTQPLLSIGQLQHANLSLYNPYPAYVVGNSLGDFHFIKNDPVKGYDKVRIAHTMTSGIDNSPTDQLASYYDLSWLVNRALWDRYFVSTVPNVGTGTTYPGSPDLLVTASTDVPDVLPNPRHVKYGTAADEDLHDVNKAAANLLLKGGFNINSTSEQAWRAVIGGINQLDYDPEGDGSSGKLKAALPRFAKPTTAPGVDATKAWVWQNYRFLTDEQIDRLAKNIVAEIRNRGPFVSLADFVNRRLVDNIATSGTNANEQFKGALQAAIDETYAGTTAPNRGEDTAYGASGSNPFYSTTVPNSTFSNTAYDAELMKGYTGASATDRPYGANAAFAPQFLTQADVLSAIGPGLTARSDTFTIRTYGEAVNPVTQDIQGRAWCEAVVQRLPDYVDSVADANAHSAPTASINKAMGRRYKIISFRWLSSNDI